MLVKWVITACEPGDSNFKHIIRHRLAQFQPPGTQKWTCSLDWFQLPQHRSRCGSHVWNRIGRAWKTFVKYTYRRGPENFDEWLSTNLWWGIDQDTLGPGFSKTRGAQLYGRGLRQNRDAWDFASNTVKSAYIIQTQFGLSDNEFTSSERLRQRLYDRGIWWLRQRHNYPIDSEWYGIFE